MDINQKFIELLLKSKSVGLTNEEWIELKSYCERTIHKADFHLKS